MRSIEERFWEKVDRNGPNGCWIWTASKARGYGQLGRGARGTGNVLAHRLAYELLVGPIPVGLDLDHLCRTPACVNPAHLEPVTHRVNIRRGLTVPATNAAKTQCKRGHAFDEANTYVTAAGRHCRRCRADTEARRRARLAIST